MPQSRLVLTVTFLFAAASCGGPAASPNGSIPSPVESAPGSPPPLPPVPEVDGPLKIRVQYPSANQQITSRDSNFIFGSIGSGKATLTINGVPARVYPNGAFMGWLVNPSASAPRYELVATKGSERAQLTHPVRLTTPAPIAAQRDMTSARNDKPENLATSRADTLAALQGRLDSLRTLMVRDEPIGVVQLGQPSTVSDTDRTIVGRPIPAGTYKWFFTPGTLVPLIERAGPAVRVRLDRDLDVYVDTGDVREMPAGSTVPRRTTTNIKVRPSADGMDVVIPTGSRAPYFVEETEHSIVLTLYGVRGNTDLVNYAAGDTMVRTVEWEQVNENRAKVTVNLRAAPYGYLVLFENNAMVLKLRGRPRISASRPLEGLVIAVDPGHPPIGATGPTGLWEPQATLPIGFRLKRMLEERGARVLMTRTTDSAVALGDRPIMARRANVNAFVSVHLNAYPDGVNPFVAPGSGTYFFRTHSEPLARFVQRGLVSRMGLQDLGVNYDNLAVVRGTWYPAVLCEGAFVILPDQEAALRTPEFQERYARGIADGLENYFRALR